MKILQKLILPLLLLLAAFIIYKFYFATGGSLGSFADFDPNNSAVKDIRVQLLADRGINQQGGEVIFYVADRNGQVQMVSGAVHLPEGFENAKVVILRGHLSQGGFHTHEVLLD